MVRERFICLFFITWPLIVIFSWVRRQAHIARNGLLKHSMIVLAEVPETGAPELILDAIAAVAEIISAIAVVVSLL